MVMPHPQSQSYDRPRAEQQSEFDWDLELDKAVNGSTETGGSGTDTGAAGGRSWFWG
jgi:hypothetical protein